MLTNSKFAFLDILIITHSLTDIFVKRPLKKSAHRTPGYEFVVLINCITTEQGAEEFPAAKTGSKGRVEQGANP